MKDLNEKIKGYFSDKDYADELISRKERNELPLSASKLLEEISDEVPPSVLLKKLFVESENDSLAVNFILSECFFIISELMNVSADERDYALDMSTYLSEDTDSRDPSFDPRKHFEG